MRIYKSIYIISILLLNVGNTFADDGEHTSKDTIKTNRISSVASDIVDGIVPPSPSVREMCKYGDIPVGYSTGTIDITIPIYNLKCGELELPISLSYHSGGIKVDENASCVGLGWTLNAGGCIGVNVVGSNDSFIGSNYDIPSYKDMTLNYETKCPYDIGELMSMSYMDLQPDIHSYNFYNYSGQFVFDMQNSKFYDLSGDKTLTWRTLSNKSYTRNLLAAKDNKGNDFVFSSFETCLATTSGHSRNMTTAWYLTKVKSFNLSDSITIDYETYNEFENIKQATSLVYGINNEDWGNGVWVNQEKRIILGSAYPYSKGTRDYLTKKVKKITASNNVCIVFDYSECREDLHGKNDKTKAALLSAITIYDMYGKRIKKWIFDYDYFRSYITSTEDETANFRLKLIALNEYGEDDTQCLSHKFNYYGEDDGEPQMPYKYSYAGKDAWGYCNGEPDKFTADDYHKAFPNFSNFSFYRLKLRKDYWADLYNMNTKYKKPMLVSYTQGESKDANELYAYAYSLKKITYPTGGSSRFVYELNHFETLDNSIGKNDGAVSIEGFGPGIRIKEIYNYDGEKETKRWFSYSVGELMNYPHLIKRRTYQFNAYQPYEIGNIDGATSHYEDQTESPEVINYIEMFSSPYNVSSIGSANNIGYTDVTEHLPDGTYKTYKFASLNLDFNSDNIIEKGTPFAGNNSFIGILEDDLEFPIYQYIDEEALEEYSTFDSSGYGCFNQITDDRYSDYDGYCGTFFYRGMPISESVFEASGELLSKTEYCYDVNVTHLIPSIEVRPHYNWQGFSYPAYSFQISHIVTGEAKLKERESFIYTTLSDGNTYIIKENELYSYNENGLLAKKVYYNSKGDTITERSTYPNDIANGNIYKKMVARNMLAYPIERIVYNNSEVMKSTLTTYSEWGNSIYPWHIYCYKPNTPDISFNTFNGIVSDKYGIPELTINEYTNGRICNYSLKDGTQKSYMWGYNWEYPILEVSGMSYKDFINALKRNNISNQKALYEKKADELFSIFGKQNMKTFAYRPLIGISKSTTHNGGANEYLYDTFGRLKSIYRGSVFTKQELQEHYTYHLKTK